MVHPVKGPTIQNVSDVNLAKLPGGWRVSRSRYTQQKPYNLVLPYKAVQWNCVRGVQAAVWPLSGWWDSVYPGRMSRPSRTVFDPSRPDIFGSFPEASRTLNRAREKFMGEANSEVALVVDALQGREAVSMIDRRLRQLARAAVYARRLDWRRFGKVLGFRAQPPKQRLRDTGSLWLEYSYGWKPFVQDLHDAAQVLSTPYGTRKIAKAAKEHFSRRWEYPAPDGVIERQVVNCDVLCSVGGFVTLTNPNLQIAKNSGLTNPAEWLWELIPFSFVVDWFVNFGDLVASLDDSAGISITQGWFTTWISGSSELSAESVSGPARGLAASKTYRISYTVRSAGIPAVRLVRSRQVLTGLTRALNASALLTQRLKP